MKTKLALVALAAIGGLAFASSASANPDIRVGIHFGSPAPVYRPAAPDYCPPAPVVVSNYGYDRNDRYDRHDRNDRYDRPSGYWKEVVVKTWVPATYVMTRDWHGRPVRRVEPAHFAYRTDRVWVSYRG
jgi:hypothetical protein